jgi:predicted dehydrogenase
MKPLRFGIIGTGRMAQAFARGLESTDQALLQAVASREAGKANAFCAEFAVGSAFSSLGQMTEDPNVDVVYVASPHSLHAAHSKLCLAAGKAVLCEKPFAINAAEAVEVIDLARNRGLFLMEALWSRFLPAYVKLRELLDQRAIGAVQLMIAGGAFVPRLDPGHYLLDPSRGGGALLDAGVYLISAASMVFGAPVSIRAVGSLGASGVDEQDAILLEHEDGSIAMLYVSLRANASPDLTLIGDLGRIYLHSPVFAPAKITVHRGSGESEVFDLPFASSGYHYQVQEVVRCMGEGRTESPLMPLNETISVMQTMDEVRRQIKLVFPMEKQQVRAAARHKRRE